jgi:hypothetical protein
MLKMKSQVTCSYCSKIYKDPILLPCEDSICREHLSERSVVKQNKIKCAKCNEEFQVNGHQFKSNIELEKLLGSRSYLGDEELSLKKELEDSIQKFFEFYDEFSQSRTKLESGIFNHYQELRFQIDEYRERLKERIDEIALAMIDQTKKSEEEYLKNVKERFSSFDDSKSLEHDLNQIDESFRNPNILIEAIKEMQRKQEESLNEIQLKLTEMNQVKDILSETNYFLPTFSPINQTEATSLFGSIKMNACWSNVNSFRGQILTNQQQYFKLIKLCEFSPNDKWTLLYRGTRDGFSAKAFHSKCDNHSNTLTLLKAKGNEFIFGGFTTVDWEACEWPGKCKSDPNAFIFSLTNKDNKPLKMKVKPNDHQCAIYCHPEFGPRFGFDGDICIANNANTTMDSYSNLSRSYIHPEYEFCTDEAQSFLAGSPEFQLDEIEVYERE